MNVCLLLILAILVTMTMACLRVNYIVTSMTRIGRFTTYNNFCYQPIVAVPVDEEKEEETEGKEQRRVYSGILNKEED